jgi:hypothetical protein
MVASNAAPAGFQRVALGFDGSRAIEPTARVKTIRVRNAEFG